MLQQSKKINKKFDVIVVGELNIDLILNKMDSFPEIGKEKLAKNMTFTLGSSSAIFASNLSSLGAKVAFLGKVGNDYFGKYIIDKLNDKSVNIDNIIIDSEINTGATIVLNVQEDRAMITYHGAMGNLSLKDIRKEILKQAKHLHFSSYFLQPKMKDGVSEMFKLAKELKLTTSFDMQWDPEEKWALDYIKVLPNVDIFLPNEQELLRLTKQSTISEALEKLSSDVNNIVVKMGSRGSLLSSSGKTVIKEAFINNNIVDAIGAGDSFNAGFIFKFINGAQLEECQEFGNLMGAINTTKPGGTVAFTNYNEIMKIAVTTFGYKK